MGNSQSNEPKGAASNSASPPSNTGVAIRQQVARRKESLPALSHAISKSNHAPPTASLISTTSHAASNATQSTRAHAHATVTPSAASSHTRARSITVPGSGLPSKTEDPANVQNPASSSMGHDVSRPKTPSRSSTLPSSPAPAPQDATSDSKTTPSNITRPVEVPASSHTHIDNSIFAPSGLPAEESPFTHGPSDFSRPPRLPLPIEEELHTPGSPIITPQNISSPIDEREIGGGLARRTSVLSSTTVDDDEIGDNELFAGDGDQSLAPTVPTTIEWNGPGDKIYVTGTFVMWERKFKLHRNKDTGRFSATLQLKPGTHHIKFLVDGDMITSDKLPTTVDFTNILVNYVEVVAPLPSTSDTQPPAPAEPIPIPGAADLAERVESKDETSAHPIEGQSTDAQASETSAVVTPTPQLAESTPAQPIPVPQSSQRQPSSSPKPQAQAPEPKPPKQVLPEPDYTSEIPEFLQDLDRYANPNDERFQRASRATSTLPHPPSLPMFLGKSILNGATPHKDDASVLIMPNHTVLNHLATSSIKSGVLATSGTTRYKRKFLTTIMYKPTSDDG